MPRKVWNDPFALGFCPGACCSPNIGGGGGGATYAGGGGVGWLNIDMRSLYLRVDPFMVEGIVFELDEGLVGTLTPGMCVGGDCVREGEGQSVGKVRRVKPTLHHILLCFEEDFVAIVEGVERAD